MADAEHRLKGFVGRRLQVGEFGHDRLDGVARHCPGQEEVEGERDPGRDEIKRQAPEYVRQLAPSFPNYVPPPSGRAWLTGQERQSRMLPDGWRAAAVPAGGSSCR